MLSSVCLVPATPLLVPQAGGAAVVLEGVRTRVLAAAEAMARRSRRWVVIGAAEAGDGAPQDAITDYPERPGRGTFSGFGPEVTVSPGGPCVGAGQPDAAMALPLLIAGWLRGALPAGVRPKAAVTGLRAGRDAEPGECLRAGRRLRARIDAAEDPVGVLVVADGPNTLTAKAPGAYDERALPVAETLSRAVAAGDAAALAGLDRRLCAGVGLDGRAALQVMAGLVGEGPVRVEHAGAEWPFGVCYCTALWLP